MLIMCHIWLLAGLAETYVLYLNGFEWPLSVSLPLTFSPVYNRSHGQILKIIIHLGRRKRLQHILFMIQM